MTESSRDHLFISYASEDGVLAEWLTLKLTAAGYTVWCDRFKLLGGESYPLDIDRAIREQTFRFVALLSRHSINKPNPLKERTLALNLGRLRQEDFLIPLNVDGLAADELPWMLSDLSYIPFEPSWAQGLTKLVEKLQSIEAPTPLADGRKVVAEWFRSREDVAHQPERIWTNLVEFKHVPPTLLRITLGKEPAPEVVAHWPHYRQNESVIWAFEGPNSSSPLDIIGIEDVDWSNPDAFSGIRLHDLVTHLLRRHIHFHCARKGMAITEAGEHLYFPKGLLPEDRLNFTEYSGHPTWLLAVGERTFRHRNGTREKYRYYLSPTFRPNLWKYECPVVQVHIRVHLTDLSGTSLESLTALRRRKRICRNWWNHQWLMRVLGVVSWLADGQESINLARSATRAIELAGVPRQLLAPVGIDERMFEPIELDELAELDGDPEEDRDSDDDQADGLND